MFNISFLSNAYFYDKTQFFCNKKINGDEEVKKILILIENTNNKSHQACYYHQLGVYFHNREFIEATNYYKKAINIRSEIKDTLLWKSNYNLGVLYKDSNNPNESLKYFVEAYAKAKDIEHNRRIRLLIGLLEGYKEIGDLSEAYQYSKRLLEISKEDIEKAVASVYLCEVLILFQDSLSSALNNSIIAQQKFESVDGVISYKSILDAFNCEGIAQNKLKNDSVALKAFNKALSLTGLTILNDSSKVQKFRIEVQNNISITLKKQKKFDVAINLLKHSLDSIKELIKNDYSFYYSVFNENLGDTYIQVDSFALSLLHYQKALINLTNNFRNEDIYQNPNPKDKTLFIYSNPYLIGVLDLKATAAYQYYQQNKEEKHLNLANQTYQTAFNFHDKLQKEISTENSRLFQAKNIVSYIENALKIAYQQQENRQDISKAAFRFMEKNKATVLLQSMNEADALQFANLPDSLLEQEKDLKIAINFHRKQLNEAIEYEDTSEIERLEKILFEEKQQYSKLINYLETNYPNYYRLKYQQNQTQLANVQKQLNNQTALLSYFVGDSSIYTLLILNDRTKLFKIQKPDDWNTIINNFREAVTLSNPAMKANPYTKKLYNQFVDNAYTLYDWLLKQALEEMEQITHLKIIPDGELNYIPFELLLSEVKNTSTVDYRNLAYLLKRYSISYHYSAGLMMEQLEQGNSDSLKNSLTYGGYAAQYKEMDSVDVDLPNIRQLVRNMADFFNGKAYLSDQAAKQFFLEDTSSYQILHLGMHGKLNDENPLSSHLVFTKDSIPNNSNLYAADLYNKKLQTKLAVLSACNTGSGTLQKGEGVMSLSRAFTYAGCPSLVMSLWSIPEKSSADLLSTFFKNIKKGNAKNVALQQAKLAFLENTSPTLSHPVYWAGLVTTGNSEALHFKEDSCQLRLAWLFLLGGLVLSILLLKIIVKKKSNLKE